MSVEKNEKPFDLKDFDSNTLVMSDDGVPYVAEAMNQLNKAVLALDDAQADAVVGSEGVVKAMQPAILAIREARNLIKCALQWHAAQQPANEVAAKTAKKAGAR